MLGTPAARVLMLHVAVLVLPEPLRTTPPQPESVVPPSVKLTVPVGKAPATVAVKMTFAPTSAGLAELDSVVVVTPVAA